MDFILLKSITGYFWHVCVAVDIWIYIFIYYKLHFRLVILLFYFHFWYPGKLPLWGTGNTVKFFELFWFVKFFELFWFDIFFRRRNWLFNFLCSSFENFHWKYADVDLFALTKCCYPDRGTGGQCVSFWETVYSSAMFYKKCLTRMYKNVIE